MATQHALVIGASMAGLLAAQTLLEHFEQVTIVERDRLPDTPRPRAGVPQARHAHILLVQGRRILEQLFPGLGDALIVDGAVLFDNSTDLRLRSRFGWMPRIPSALQSISCSRDLLEYHVRRRVLAAPGIRLLEQHDVAGLIADATGTGVAGVRVRSRAEPERRLEPLFADLVVDASGRGSRVADWLAELGFERPASSTVDAHVAYATGIYERPAGHVADWKVLAVGPLPSIPRTGGVYSIEGGRWIVTLAGYEHDHPPRDEAGFLAFAASLASPLVYRTIRDARLLGPISGYQRTENHVRHFERLRRWPERFVALGDAVCCFNPAYGQGMTNAAIGAQLLSRELQAGGPRVAQRYQRRLAQHNRTAWSMATGSDFEFASTTGTRPGPAGRLAQWYTARLIATAVDRPQIYLRFAEVVHFVRPPETLGHPRVLRQVLIHALARWINARAAVGRQAQVVQAEESMQIS